MTLSLTLLLAVEFYDYRVRQLLLWHFSVADGFPTLSQSHKALQ